MTRKSRTKDLLDKIREYVNTNQVGGVTKEGLAKRFGARQHEVAHVLHQLNLEGIMSRAHHVFCPDPRCWHPDYYNILEQHK